MAGKKPKLQTQEKVLKTVREKCHIISQAHQNNTDWSKKPLKAEGTGKM